MKIDITLRITPEMLRDAQGNENKALAGHIGTHFDVMNKEFPLEYTERKGVVFDVSGVQDRDVGVSDVDLDRVEADMFVAFFTGFIETEEYGTKRYFREHPQLSHELIEALVNKSVSIIGLDFAGVRRGKEHIPADQACADRGVFIIENLCSLRQVLEAGGAFHAHTYPVSYVGATGLPCRVIADV